MSRLPQRIVCLSTETVEVLYDLGEEDRIVGISGFTVRPPRARKEKPKVSGFSMARPEKILAVQPDLVLAFSDLQADICHDLMKAGVAVHVFNQRSVDGILAMVEIVGQLVGATDKALALVSRLESDIAAARQAAALRKRRPRVYFEEWDDPMISAIGWVSELIAIAGGEDVFAELAQYPKAAQRVIADPDEVLRRCPDMVIGSWCGKKFRPEHVARRDGWQALPAVSNGALYEIKSAEILSPGPVAISVGLPHIVKLFDSWAAAQD